MGVYLVKFLYWFFGICQIFKITHQNNHFSAEGAKSVYLRAVNLEGICTSAREATWRVNSEYNGETLFFSLNA